MRVKICGIRNKEDLDKVLLSAPDAIGFICGTQAFSEDAIDQETVYKLVREIPPYINSVLVTHLIDTDAIINIANYTKVDTIQLHGINNLETSKKLYNHTNFKIVSTVHIENESAIKIGLELSPFCDAILLDTLSENRYGGTGKIHDWNISSQIVSASPKPVILAGGLSPSNLVKAVDQVKPYGLDVNSGVEDSNGDKDLYKMKTFIKLAKN